MIAHQADHYAIADLCYALSVSRSGYYAWHNWVTNLDELAVPVTQVFWQHSRCYGLRRIIAELQAQGYLVGRR